VFAIVLIGCPVVSKPLLGQVFDTEFIVQNKALWKIWLGFSKIVLETLLALMIGASVFAEQFRTTVRKQLEIYSEIREKALQHKLANLRGEFSDIAKEIEDLQRDIGVNFGSMLHNLVRLFKLSKSIQTTVFAFPKRYRKLAQMALLVGFPGGTYGLLAFLLFLLLTMVKVMQVYVDVLTA